MCHPDQRLLLETGGEAHHPHRSFETVHRALWPRPAPSERAGASLFDNVQVPLETAQRLFTPRFFLMCGFSFTVFLSAFQLLPVAPYRILALGGSAAAAGLFLGFLTYSSATTAPLTGSLVDRLGS